MKAEKAHETLLNIYEATHRRNPDDSHLHTRRHENLKPFICTFDSYCDIIP
jgi:hypothetical protein